MNALQAMQHPLPVERSERWPRLHGSPVEKRVKPGPRASAACDMMVCKVIAVIQIFGKPQSSGDAKVATGLELQVETEMADFDVEGFVAEMDRMGLKLTTMRLADGKFRVNR
jgi:hypothetical protein